MPPKAAHKSLCSTLALALFTQLSSLPHLVLEQDGIQCVATKESHSSTPEVPSRVHTGTAAACVPGPQ